MAVSSTIKPSAKIIADAIKKSLPPEKLTEALEKVRKDATASFTFSKILTIVHTLGWKLEAISAWVPLHYPYQDRWHLRTATSYKPEDLPSLHNLHAKMVSETAKHLPEKVTIGKKIFMNVGPIKDGSHGIHYFEWKEWVGADGIRLTTPRNETFELLPDHHDIDKPLERGMYRFHRLFTKGGWKEDASAALGKDIHIPAAARTRENTGTCPVCWRNHKLLNGRLVLHGYQRPGWGHVSGQCDGRGFEPLETSVDGAKMWLEKLSAALKKDKKTLTDIESGKVHELLHPRSKKWLKLGDPDFAALFDRFERDTRSNIKLYERDVELYQKIISVWKLRPLPKDGELQRGTSFFLKP